VACSDPRADVKSLHATGRYAQSIEILQALLDDTPNDPEIQYLYGEALLRTGKADLAIWPLRRATESPDWAVRAGLSLAKSAFAVRNWDGAVEASSQVLALEPDRLDALTLRAQAYLEGKTEPELALADFDHALELSPGDRDLRISKALTLINLERDDEAGLLFAELAEEAKLKVNPTDVDARACATLATFTKERGEEVAAGAVFDECLEIFPASSVMVQEALQYFDEQKNEERSLEILERALEVNPRLAVIRDELARRLSTAGETEAAQRVLLEGTEVEDPAAAAYAWSILADHHRGREEYQEAAEAFGKALALERNPAADRLLVYADLLGIAGQHEKALQVATSLQEPLYVDLVEARRFSMQDRPQAALKRLDSVLLRWPNNAGARYQAARAAEKLGDFDRAIEEYRQSIRADPKETDAGLRLGRLNEQLGQFEPALIAVNNYLNDYRMDAQGMHTAIRVVSGMEEPATLKSMFDRAAARQLLPEAVTARADWLVEVGRSEDAIQLIHRSELDVSDPRNAQVLRILVKQLAIGGEGDEALVAVDLALAAHPDSAAFREARGLVLEATGNASAEAENEYRVALELEPDYAPALEGLARLAAEQGATSRAADLYRRVLDAGSKEPATMRAAAALMMAAGRNLEAAETLDALLDEHPYDALAALQRAEQHLAQTPPEPARARRLARTAQIFGAGPQARKLLERIDANPDNL